MSGELEVRGIACSVFRPEIELLTGRGDIGFPVSYVDSKLHMEPAALENILQRAVDDTVRNGVGVILFFGDCHIKMRRLVSDARIVRLDGLNCAQMLLGRQRYRELMREGSFFLFPEWAMRWRDIFSSLGMSCAQTGLHMFRDAHRKVTYLDTGAAPVPQAELDACSDFAGLPVEVISVSLDHFSELVHSALTTLRSQLQTSRHDAP